MSGSKLPDTPSDRPGDETLLAYADGQLPPDEAAAVARYLDTSAEARRFVDQLRTSAELAREAFEIAPGAQVEDRLAALILGTAPRAAAAAADNVVALQPRRRLVDRVVPRQAWRMAAAILILVGSLGGYELGRRAGAPGETVGTEIVVGRLGAGTPVATLLETRASGDPLPIGGKRELMVVGSFRDRAGRACREFEVVSSDPSGAPVVGAVACRHGDGHWHVEGAVAVAAAPQIVPGEAYAPAGGGDGAAIQGILDALGAKSALSRSEEDALLSKGWK